MDLYEAIRTRRSVRQFLPEPVPREVLERIVAAGVEAPSGCNMQLRQYVIVDDPKVMDQLRPTSRAVSDAAAAIVVLIEPQGTKYGEFYIQDASAAIMSMLLAAVAEGYASCWVEGHVHRHEPQLRELLAVPEPLRVWAILPVGRPAAEATRPEKSPPATVTHYDRYGGKES